ncbi:PIN domain-containing protein [Tangfeifania diversioriginum]|uniref:PIN domain-containing protein n=1 Tax=Tangfeifania diversioriginum TaxID=1168035 RepID=A0A1M6P4S0_9BACT|nr:PIN domain-containing protein [Tangfeifania diversioriginum]SHK02965.1 PIN domain-containing protein [Tangfeifania diversioriginum]
MPAVPNKIKRVLLDVNVCIDIIVNRSLSPETKKELFAVFIQNKSEVFVPAFSIDTVYYILNSSMKIDKQVAKNAIQKLLKFTKLLHTTDETIHKAFVSNFSDFEDALINSLAETNKMDVILTNNISDFSKSSLLVYRPADFIALFK